ncbi:MAG: hypothetical protein WC960_06170 [Bacteroidales bacterium]
MKIEPTSLHFSYTPPSFEVLELEFEQNILGGSGDLPEELEGIEWP